MRLHLKFTDRIKMRKQLVKKVPTSDCKLPELVAEELRLIARKERSSVSEIDARFIHERFRQRRSPYIEFRCFNGERHACIKGALQV